MTNKEAATAPSETENLTIELIILALGNGTDEKQSRQAEYDRWQLRLGGIPGQGQCPAVPLYGISEKPQCNVRVKIDTPEKG
jgi:hypothetical protein